MSGNLGPGGVRGRLALSVLALGAAALMLGTRLQGQARLLLLLPFMLSSMGYLQAREKT